MSRRYADPIDVRRADDAPTEFVWRGRIYSVRAVLGHWMEAGGWWARAVPHRGGGLDEGEQEIWRVEARAGRGGSPGVFDLRFDWSGGGWSLARALD
ncbi:MAG: DUF6504 family protein [Actinomycetes bacterium]